MNYQVRDAHWSLRSIWTRTSMISTFVFDAALRTVSAALLLSFCLSFFRDLWSRRSLASLRNLSCGSKYIKVIGRGRMDTKQKARSSSSVSRAGALVDLSNTALCDTTCSAKTVLAPAETQGLEGSRCNGKTGAWQCKPVRTLFDCWIQTC